jgi:hypothetical protein
MNRSSGKRDEPPPRPITFRAADNLGPFDLAQLWCDRTVWPIEDRTQYDELSELAVMSALAAWLRRWQPVAVHSSILAGASPEAVAGALGTTVETTYDVWREWALRLRDFVIGDKPDMGADEYSTVDQRFTEAGCPRTSDR